MKVDFNLSELILLDRAVRQRRKIIVKSMEELEPDTDEFGYKVDGLKSLDKLHEKIEGYKRKARRESSEEYKERIGEEGYSADGKKIKIIRYTSSKNITVQFEDGQVLSRQSYNKFKNRKIRSKRAYEASKKK